MAGFGKFPLLFLALTSLGGCALKDSTPTQSDASVKSRNMHSPNIYSDPNAQKQWAAAIEALEKQCEATGKYCAEAEKARESLSRNSD